MDKFMHLVMGKGDESDAILSLLQLDVREGLLHLCLEVGFTYTRLLHLEEYSFIQ